MKLIEIRIEIETEEDWTDDKIESVCQEVLDTLDNLGDIVKQMLSKIPEKDKLKVIARWL